MNVLGQEGGRLQFDNELCDIGKSSEIEWSSYFSSPRTEIACLGRLDTVLVDELSAQIGDYN